MPCGGELTGPVSGDGSADQLCKVSIVRQPPGVRPEI